VRSVHLRRAAGTGSREQVRPRMIGNNMLLVFALMISSFCSRLACERMKWVGVPEQAANMAYVCARCSSACAFEHMITFVLSETCMSAVALIVLWSSYCFSFRVGYCHSLMFPWCQGWATHQCSSGCVFAILCPCEVSTVVARQHDAEEAPRLRLGARLGAAA